MKSYLLDTFRFNDIANKKLLTKIRQLPDKTEAIRLFSHLVNCPNKWMARIVQDPKIDELSWWEPLYNMDEIENAWTDSLVRWTDYLHSKTEEELNTEVPFTGYDGGQWAATPQDIALQLNYHSIHHRAQIQTLIRQQGLVPDFLDYIGTRYRRISD